MTRAAALISLLVLLVVPSYGGVKFYDEPVCFYGSCTVKKRAKKVKKKLEKPVKKPIVRKDEHYEKVKELFTENGRTPPEPVLRLLAYPTKENAMRYINWAAERSFLMAKAMAVVRKAVAERNKSILKENAPLLSFIFVHSPTCPYCIAMSGTIKRLKKEYPEVKLACVSVGRKHLLEGLCDEVYEGDVGKAIAEGLGARGYPFLVVKRKSVVIDRISGNMLYDVLLERLVFDLQLKGEQK